MKLIDLLTNWKLLALATAIGFAGGCALTVKLWNASEAAELRRSIEQGRWHAAGLEIQLELERRKNRDVNRRYADETRKDAYRCPLPTAATSLLNEARKSVDSTEVVRH